MALLSWDDWKNHIVPTLDVGFLDDSSPHYEFRSFYKFCFQFNLSGTHRTLDKELVCGLLPLVVQDRVDTERLSSFVTFLERKNEKETTRITFDQWTSFYDFCQQVPDLRFYDESTSAWPVLIDEYVDYMEQASSSKK
jgi:hypothetical protein